MSEPVWEPRWTWLERKLAEVDTYLSESLREALYSSEAEVEDRVQRLRESLGLPPNRPRILGLAEQLKP